MGSVVPTSEMNSPVLLSAITLVLFASTNGNPQELQQEGRDAQGRPLTTSLGIGNRFGGNRFGGRFSNSFRERLRNILRGKRSPQELQQEGRDAQGAFGLATGFGRGNRNRKRFGGRFSDRLRERFRNRGCGKRS